MENQSTKIIKRKPSSKQRRRQAMKMTKETPKPQITETKGRKTKEITRQRRKWITRRDEINGLKIIIRQLEMRVEKQKTIIAGLRKKLSSYAKTSLPNPTPLIKTTPMNPNLQDLSIKEQTLLDQNRSYRFIRPFRRPNPHHPFHKLIQEGHVLQSVFRDGSMPVNQKPVSVKEKQGVSAGRIEKKVRSITIEEYRRRKQIASEEKGSTDLCEKVRKIISLTENRARKQAERYGDLEVLEEGLAQNQSSKDETGTEDRNKEMTQINEGESDLEIVKEVEKEEREVVMVKMEFGNTISNEPDKSDREKRAEYDSYLEKAYKEFKEIKKRPSEEGMTSMAKHKGYAGRADSFEMFSRKKDGPNGDAADGELEESCVVALNRAWIKPEHRRNVDKNA